MIGVGVKLSGMLFRYLKYPFIQSLTNHGREVTLQPITLYDASYMSNDCITTDSVIPYLLGFHGVN